MARDSVTIDWSYEGAPNYSVGSGATWAESALGWAGAALGVGLYLMLYLTGALPWSDWQYLLAAGLALDVGGGLVCNSLNSCKRFYSSPPRPSDSRLTRLLKHHLLFSGLHLHTILIGLVYPAAAWRSGLFWYIALQVCALVVLQTPLYLRRPTAMLLILVALLVSMYLLPLAQGFEWLVPGLFIKIVYGHLVREEPYRPAR